MKVPVGSLSEHSPDRLKDVLAGLIAAVTLFFLTLGNDLPRICFR
jgi:hypothetical protein